MSQHSRVPEYSVVESRETHHMVNGPLEEQADWSQVVVALQELSRGLTICGDILEIVRIDTGRLAVLLREQR